VERFGRSLGRQIHGGRLGV